MELSCGKFKRSNSLHNTIFNIMWGNEYKNSWIKEIAIRIKQSIKNGYLVNGSCKEKILYYLSFKKLQDKIWSFKEFFNNV